MAETPYDTSNQHLLDFTAVYQQHRLSIYRYILARIGHIEDAQDITAQVFLKAYQRAGSYRQEAPVIAWLMGICRHQIIDYYRQQHNNISLSLISDIPAYTPPLDDVIEQRHRLQRVTEALNALSEDRREAIAMRLFAGLKNQEIADIMDKSPDAVAMLVYRGIQDLKTRLKAEDYA